MLRRAPTPIAALAAASVLSLAIAGCSSSSASSVAPPGSPTAAPTTPAPTAGPSTESATPTLTPAVVTTAPTSPTEPASLCRLAELSVAPGQRTGAAGSIGLAIVFHNVSSRTCQLRGYPGVAGLDATGRQAVQAVRNTTGNGVPGLVTLAPGTAASALVLGSDVPVGTATGCPNFTLLVTPPGETHTVRLPASLPGCSALRVYPVVRGTAGL